MLVNQLIQSMNHEGRHLPDMIMKTLDMHLPFNINIFYYSYSIKNNKRKFVDIVYVKINKFHFRIDKSYLI